MERLAAGLGVRSDFAPTVQHYLDILEATYMVRRLPPWTANLGKRLTKSPEVYLQDSELLYALLDIHGVEDLYGHPVGGAPVETGYPLVKNVEVLPAHELGNGLPDAT